LSHIWQRFLLTSSLLVGFAVGVAATVFGYSNLASVDVRWSVFHINGVPLWTVALVPVALTIAAGAVYHWMDSLHHFTEHMRHRHRVHELEAELGALRGHLDQVEPSLLRRGQRFLDGQHAELRSVGGNHADRADPDLPVDSDARRFVVRVFDRQVPFSST